MRQAHSTISCWECAHFSISWDKARRYQCNKLGFKSRNLPSIEVLQTDGRQCLSFSQKDKSPKRK